MVDFCLGVKQNFIAVQPYSKTKITFFKIRMEIGIKQSNLINYFFFNLRKGDVVVFSGSGRDCIKRITAASGKNKFLAAGDNSSHSRSYTIARSQVKGKLLIKY